ncbi:hypothetical protein [Neoroseomonas terrae]|uniref:hypothetical protein n=1 Tax=Neoroseomonas terrae TaxID=424799 RepID=UPI001BAC6B65|nr:hypothetical protein [Neoroseomonas terrae]
MGNLAARIDVAKVRGDKTPDSTVTSNLGTCFESIAHAEMLRWCGIRPSSGELAPITT